MTITLELPTSIQEQAEALAAERQKNVATVALDLLAESLSIHAAGRPSQHARRSVAVAHVRILAEERGLDWETRDNDDPEPLIDDLLHE